MKHVAACSCGTLTVTCEGDPVRVSICHCLACQRRTGSIFGVQARFPKSAVTIEGTSKEWVRVGDEGTHIHFNFCPTCGATVYYTAEWMADSIALPVGAFADPTFPPPRFAVYETRRHPWAVMPDLACERLD
jgi:hypothetical protein